MVSYFMTIHSKLPNVGTTIFTIMSQLAIEHKAVNLGQGFPDFMMSDELTAFSLMEEMDESAFSLMITEALKFFG